MRLLIGNLILAFRLYNQTMSTIYLIRHGQKKTHAGDPSLTEAGIKQAQETGKYLRQFPITKVIASPLRRTVETVQAITQELGLDFTKDEALVERMTWSDPQIERADFVSEWIKSTKNRTYVPKYGDSSLATGARIAALIEREAKPDDHLVLVGHGGAIIDYLRSLFGDEKKRTCLLNMRVIRLIK